jgi:hypothetical protein
VHNHDEAQDNSKNQQAQRLQTVEVSQSVFPPGKSGQLTRRWSPGVGAQHPRVLFGDSRQQLHIAGRVVVSDPLAGEDFGTQ